MFGFDIGKRALLRASIRANPANDNLENIEDIEVTQCIACEECFIYSVKEPHHGVLPREKDSDSVVVRKLIAFTDVRCLCEICRDKLFPA
jgi:hypothetical protein